MKCQVALSRKSLLLALGLRPEAKMGYLYSELFYLAISPDAKEVLRLQGIIREEIWVFPPLRVKYKKTFDFPVLSLG